jgi:hypothetical protein
MQIGMLEMPAEGSWRVQLDGEVVHGYFKREKHEERYAVHLRKDGAMTTLRTKPHSREGASCLILFHHFEEERKRLIAEAEAQRQAEAEAQAANAAVEEEAESADADS